MHTIENYKNNLKLFVDDVSNNQVDPEAITSFIKSIRYGELHTIFNENKGLASAIVNLQNDRVLVALLNGLGTINLYYRNWNQDDYYNHDRVNIFQYALNNKDKFPEAGRLALQLNPAENTKLITSAGRISRANNNADNVTRNTNMFKK